MPLYLLFWPQRKLRRLVGMLIDAWVSYPSEMVIIRLPFNGVFGEGIVSILKCQGILKNRDERLAACESLFPVQEEIAKLCIACFVQHTPFTNGGEGPIDQCWLWLHAFDPTEHRCRAVTVVITVFMRHMPLMIVVQKPFLMRCK